MFPSPPREVLSPEDGLAGGRSLYIIGPVRRMASRWGGRPSRRKAASGPPRRARFACPACEPTARLVCRRLGICRTRPRGTADSENSSRSSQMVGRGSRRWPFPLALLPDHQTFFGITVALRAFDRSAPSFRPPTRSVPLSGRSTSLSSGFRGAADRGLAYSADIIGRRRVVLPGSRSCFAPGPRPAAALPPALGPGRLGRAVQGIGSANDLFETCPYLAV